MAAHQRGSRVDTPLLEWVLGALGLLILIAAIAFLILRALQSPTPPDITLRPTGVDQVSTGYLLRFIAHNAGSDTAADLHLEAVVTAGEREIERVEMTLDFLPGRSSREGGFFLTADPRAHQVELKATGYQKP